MGNITTTPLAVCEANKEEEDYHSTMNEDWTKEDLNRHLRDLLLHHGDFSPPPRSVSIIERTPMVVGSSSSTGTTTITGSNNKNKATTTENDTVDDDDTALSQYKSPRESSPLSFHEPLVSSPSSNGSMTTAAQVEEEEEVLLMDEESMYFLFEDVVTTPLMDDLSSGRRRNNNSNCFVVWWYCSRLFRTLCLCFVRLWLFARDKVTALMIHKPRRPSSSSSCLEQRSEQNQSLLPQVVAVS
jgi:hypothetical protein